MVNEFRFYHGTMSSMKTATLLMTNHSLRAKGHLVWLLKSAIDTRSGADVIASRVGLCANADAVIGPNDSPLFLLNTTAFSPRTQPDIILVDEAQFLTAQQIAELREIVSFKEIPVYCYGLRTDASTKLFEGSKRLIELADVLIELENHCDCGAKAIISARVDNEGHVVMPNSQIDIGGNEKYKPMCYRCWRQGGGEPNDS